MPFHLETDARSDELDPCSPGICRERSRAKFNRRIFDQSERSMQQGTHGTLLASRSGTSEGTSPAPESENLGTYHRTYFCTIKVVYSPPSSARNREEDGQTDSQPQSVSCPHDISPACPPLTRTWLRFSQDVVARVSRDRYRREAGGVRPRRGGRACRRRQGWSRRDQDRGRQGEDRPQRTALPFGGFTTG